MKVCCKFRIVWFLAVLTASGNLEAQSDPQRGIQLHYERAQAAIQANQLDTAADEFREILRLDSKSAATHANLGVIMFKQGKYELAAASFGQAIKLNPSLWDAEAFLGLSHSRLGHSREAKPLLEQSLQRIQNQSLRTEVGMDLIRIAQESNSLDRAVDLLREIERSSPTDPEVLYVAYRVYSDLAAHALASLAQAAPASARMHQILAQAALTQEDVTGAIAEYRKALAIDPQLPGVHYELGRAIMQISQEESARQEAQKEFETELAANPSDANSEYELGQLYWFRSNPHVAAEHYSRALELRPDFVDAHLALGKVLSSAEQPEAALAHFLEAARLDPKNEIAHYRLAQAYRKAERTEEANREQALFQKLRESHLPAHSVYGQRQQKPSRTEEFDPKDQ